MSEAVSETLRELGPAAAGGYFVLSLLKEGAHSRVFLAEKEGKRFVLKAPASDGGRNLDLLRREWEMSVGLSHPGLRYVFTWEPESPVGPCIVQEWVDGRNLTAFLAEKPSLASRKRMFGQLLDVVSYLHKKGVMHNDLSPANVLITRSDDAVKIIDLGYADDDAHVSVKSLGGTRGYASPALLNGDAVDARSDVWTLGALMQEIFPGRYGRVVRRCLSERPDRRYCSVDDLRKAWEGYWWPLWISLAVLFVFGLGMFAWSYVGTRAALDARNKAEMELSDALSAAKAEVDAWYDTAVPAFRSAIAAASSADEVNAAWTDLLGQITTLNADIPSRTPESVRPALRDYTIQRYYDTFPSLQQALASRLDELQ